MAKTKKTARPIIGAERLNSINALSAGLIPHVRVAEGLARALVAIYGPRLEEAEETLTRLGGQASDDSGAAYLQQMTRTQELRGLVAIVTTAAKELGLAGLVSERVEKLTRNLGRGA